MAKRGKWVKVAGWKRGRAWREPDGTLTFHIRRQIGGRPYEVSTGCTSLRAAMAQFERFEADPAAYSPGGVERAEPIYLDNDLSVAFLAWSKAEGNTVQWVGKQKSCLAWWMVKLARVDLRRASLRDHILPPLEGAPGRAHKIRVLKTLYGWLRKVRHVIAAHEDPTFGALPAPPSKPAQRVKSKVIPKEHYLLVRDSLTSPWRNALIVQAGTGWHTTEVVRFASSGTIEPLPKSMKVGNGAEGVLVCPMHKSGDTHRTAVSAEVLEAAKRLREHGAFSREWYDRAVRSACKTVKRPDGEAGIPMFTPGRLRHSVATWAIEAGAVPAAVSAFLGHKSPVTTAKFYTVHAVVPKVPTLA
jgi:integrase